nr:urea ABC transporter permease subunit UrtB [Desulfolithobacter dissulfuricans]
MRLFVAVLLLAAFAVLPCLAASENAGLDEAIVLLRQQSFQAKAEGIEKLGISGSDKAEKILKMLLEGNLYYTKKDGVLVQGEKDGRKYHITDVISGQSLGTVKKRALKKITINNSLRTQIKSVLASMDLTHSDPDRRLAAVTRMLANPQPALAGVLRERLAGEADSRVRKALAIAVALVDLKAKDPSLQLKALERLGSTLNPAAANAIRQVIQVSDNEELRKKAQAALDRIEARVSFFRLLETMFFGLSLGSVLVLAAIGLAITFGVIGVINMAHGELIMLGAYTTWVMQQLMPHSIGLAVLLAIPAAFIVSGLVGIVIEKSVIRFLYGRPLETLLATFGISLILQQTVRTIFSPLNRSVETPAWMSGSLQINSVLSLTVNRLTILGFSMLVFAVLFLILKKTSLGLQVRAVAQNRAMAMAMGVRAARVDALTFGLGSGIAGIAGVALSQLTNVGPNLGQAYIIDSFMVVVFGGVGNLWGTLVGGLSLGVANKFLEPWAGAVLAKILILVFIILFIQKRPQGLFPRRAALRGNMSCKHVLFSYRTGRDRFFLFSSCPQPCWCHCSTWV